MLVAAHFALLAASWKTETLSETNIFYKIFSFLMLTMTMNVEYI